MHRDAFVIYLLLLPSGKLVERVYRSCFNGPTKTRGKIPRRKPYV
jgi:hypothetical protein